MAGLVCAIAVFPATIAHIFGYRGDYATKNLTGFSTRKFISYIGYVNKAYFAGLLPVILLIVIALIIVYIVSKFDKSEERRTLDKVFCRCKQD